jgi:hypothetical protein
MVSNRLAPEQKVVGTLATGDGLLVDQTLFDLYDFDGRPGQFITATLSSQDFDPSLVLVDPHQQIIASNDDANPKEGKNALLALPIPAKGTYHVWVNSNTFAEGRYTLQMSAEDRTETKRVLHVGETAQGWLMPGDSLSGSGVYIDNWTVKMQSNPIVIWMRSNEFDTYLRALKPDGSTLIKDDDVNFVAGDGNSRIVLEPSSSMPEGAEVTIEASSSGKNAVAGAYQLQAFLLPADYSTMAIAKIRPVVVSGSQITDKDISASIKIVNEIWKQCGISIEIADDGAVKHTKIDELSEQMKAGDRNWTTGEIMLQNDRYHALYGERIITVYFVRKIDGGERYGIAYPSTRYPPTRSGLIAVSDDARRTDDIFGATLAHEIGHMLGLEHPNDITGDGDPWNDTKDNLMNANQAGHILTSLQCLTARGETHHLFSNNNKPLVSPEFLRSDRTLQPGDIVTDALTTQNVPLPEGQFIEVYYFYGQKGEQVTIDLSSAAFDPVLLLDGPDDTRIAMDDDSGDGWNATLSLVLPTTGDYSIGITSFQPGVGVYRLTIEAGGEGSRDGRTPRLPH